MKIPDSQIFGVASDWLKTFGHALETKDIDGLVRHFSPNGWLRDALVFGWDYHSLEGREKIKSYLHANDAFIKTTISNVVLDTRPDLAPEEFSAGPDINGIWFAFSFETPSTLCRGFASLVPDVDVDGKQSWKALAVYVAVEDIKGHEESLHELGVYEGHTKPWGEVKAERVASVEKNPYALIIGAGQCGLMVGARLRAMGIPAIVIEKMPRVGDNWRIRYPMLTLHTMKMHHEYLYAPFPKNWPMFTPRDKLANWMEQYADTQDLVVWTSSTVLPTPRYDESSGRWSVNINKNGTVVALNPAHIIIATGVLGEPIVPNIPSASLFRGITMHSSKYVGGKPFAGKTVLVVGSGTSAADVCQDLVTQGATGVTIMQRSSAYIVSSTLLVIGLGTIYKEGVEVDVNDFKHAALPQTLRKQILASEPMQKFRATFDKEMREGLTKRGFKLNEGVDGSGILVYEMLGGYSIDVGASKMIIDGRIKVKSGVEISEFTETGVKYTDGSAQDVDVVIFATSYKNIRSSMETIFGQENIGRTKKVWGLDEEGEINGCYRPSGHPGLWYAVGDFYNARAQSKQLALHLKAQQIGMSRASVGLASSKLPDA